MRTSEKNTTRFGKRSVVCSAVPEKASEARSETSQPRWACVRARSRNDGDPRAICHGADMSMGNQVSIWLHAKAARLEPFVRSLACRVGRYRLAGDCCVGGNGIEFRSAGNQSRPTAAKFLPASIAGDRLVVSSSTLVFV